MTDYEENSVSRTSSYALKVKNVRSKPGSLPWEEESMTFGRDQGVILLRLQRENQDLRKKLKDFNSKINEIIYKFKAPQQSKKPSETRPADILENVQKKLIYYEKEYKRIENRIYSLSDFGYEAGLKNEISKSEQKVLELENNIRKFEAKQKLRSKELGGVLDTGEKAENHREFLEMSKEITVYTQKVMKLEELGRQTIKSIEDFRGKIREFEKKFEDLGVESESVEKEENKTKGVMEKKKREENAVEGKYRSGLKLLEIKVKKLTEDLAKSKAEEESLMQELEKRKKNFQEKQLDLSDLQIKATANFSKKPVKNSHNFPDDYMFITEQIE